MEYIVWESLGGGTRLLMNQLHYGGLLFMIVAYSFKIFQLLQKPVAVEGTPARGDAGRAIKYAYLTLAMPWELESQRRHWFRYGEFVMFHMAMAIGIGFAFIVPLAHGLMQNVLIALFCQFMFSVGFLIGLSRLFRRIFSAEMRRISTPDDYFCLFLLSVWMFSGIFAAPLMSVTWLTVFYGLATFFLVYVPFSKISHYVYYPFIRFYVGRHFGHRGVFPKKGTIEGTI